MDETTPRSLAAELDFSRRINPKVIRTVYHASLSLPHNESLDDDTWHEIAQKYLRGMGFTMNQYVVVRHTDRTHDHAHIVASRIRLDGTTVSDSWDYPRSEAVIRKLEKEYNLQTVQPSRRKDSRSPTTGESRQLARTGEESVRVKLQQAIGKATQDYPMMPELIQRLKQYGINVRVGYTRTGKVKGISYQLDSVAFSGTHLGKAYTFPGLQKHRGVSYSSKRDDTLIQRLMEQSVEKLILAMSTKQDDQLLQIQSIDKNATSPVLTEQDDKRIQIERTDKNPAPVVSQQQDDKRIQVELTEKNTTLPVLTQQDNKRIQIEPTNQNPAPLTQQTNNLPIPEPANWEQVRLKLSQQYNLPDSLLSEMYQKGWLYASKTGQPVFVERTLNDLPTQVKQLEPTGDFTAIPLTSEPAKNGSFWLATDNTVTRAVLLNDPIEVLSVVALESTIDQKQRKPTLYWSVGESEQVPWEFLRSLETVTIAFPTERCENGGRLTTAFKDNEKAEDLVSKILAELPQAKRVSPSQASWNKLLANRTLQPYHSQIPQPKGWEL